MYCINRYFAAGARRLWRCGLAGPAAVAVADAAAGAERWRKFGFAGVFLFGQFPERRFHFERFRQFREFGIKPIFEFGRRACQREGDRGRADAAKLAMVYAEAQWSCMCRGIGQRYVHHDAESD